MATKAPQTKDISAEDIKMNLSETTKETNKVNIQEEVASALGKYRVDLRNKFNEYYQNYQKQLISETNVGLKYDLKIKIETLLELFNEIILKE